MNKTSGRWVPVGWQHLYLETPDNWSIGAVSGDAGAGYLRLDDAEMPRVEIRWEKAKGNETVEKAVDRYLDALVKKTRRKAPPVKVRRDLSLLKNKKQLEDRTAEGFHWKTEGDEPIQAYGMLWRCDVCARIVFIQVLAPVGETLMPLASRLLNTLNDHADGDTAIWAMYGMQFEAPEAYTLSEYQFLTGRLMLRFSGDQHELKIERHSLAEIHLDGRPFDAWFDETGEGTVDEQGDPVDGVFQHQAIITSGSMVDPADSKKRMTWLPWRRPGILQFNRCGWHCQDENKLYTVLRLSKESDAEQMLQIARTLKCH